MTKKERRARPRPGRAKGNVAKDPVDNKFTNDDNDDDAAAQVQPKEVFDSSKYDAMTDMTKGSNFEAKDARAFARRERIINSVKPEHINNEEIVRTTSDSVASSLTSDEDIAKSKITAMVVEERARTIREVKEDEKMPRYLTPHASSSHRSEIEKKFVLYLNILLSMENAGAERLHSRVRQSPLEQLQDQLAHHLEETKEQKNRLITLIQNLGGQPTKERADLSIFSPPKALADALKASATTVEEQELRMMESDALLEYAEVLGYNMAIQMATKINISQAIISLRQNLQEEEKMVAWMRANLPSNFVQLWSKIDKGPKIS